jgi:multiple sugar transport system permease protein/arabinosaccharide transport system permease protein
VNAILVAVAGLAIYPYLVMLFGGFKSSAELTTNPGGPPSQPTLANFSALLTGPAGEVMWRSLLNSLVVTIPYTTLTVLLCAMAGYAFAKYRFPGRSVIFGILIASMLVPIEVNIPALYLLFSNVGWLDTYQVQIFPGTASVLGMFMARQYMRGIPDEVLDAARVDGAGHWTTFFRIALPMSAPILGAIAVLTFVYKWSDYLWPAVMVNDPHLQPIMVTLPALSTNASGFIVRYEILLAGALIVTLPLLLVFGRFQKSLTSGSTVGAVRG